jgi:hypothetical protein
LVESIATHVATSYSNGYRRARDGEAFADIKKYTLDIARSMLRCEMQPDPAYMHGFAHYYAGLGFDFDRPAPISYAKHWSKVDWSDQSLQENMNWWREAEADEPEYPHVMDLRSGYLAL